MGKVVRFVGKKDKYKKDIFREETSNFINDALFSINEKLNSKPITKFDKRWITEKIVIPESVQKKNEEIKGTYNGKNKISNVSYYKAYIYNQRTREIDVVEAPISKLNSCEMCGYIAKTVYDLVYNKFWSLNYNIRESIRDRDYQTINYFIDLKNTIIEQGMMYGISKSEIENLLLITKKKLNKDFNEY